MVCLIDDGTGKIQLKQYFEQPIVGEDEESPFAQITEGCFVWAVGALRTGNDPYISINQIRKITSANEIAYHLLASCSAHIDIVEEKDGTFGATPMRSFNSMQAGSASAVQFGGGFDIDATPMKPVSAALSASTGMPAGQIEEKVYQFIQSGKTTQWGFSKSDCVLKFKGVCSEDEINKAIEQLLDDARIYDTGDEVHFKSIE